MAHKRGEPYLSPTHDADYIYTGVGEGIQVVPRTQCARGHPVAHIIGWGVCPRCDQHTHVYYCADLRCDGEVTSYRHEEKCPP